MKINQSQKKTLYSQKRTFYSQKRNNGCFKTRIITRIKVLDLILHTHKYHFMKNLTSIFLLFSNFLFSQNNFDSVLEKYIDNDEFELAKVYVKKELKPFNKEQANKYVYYNAKAGFIYLRLGITDSALYFSKNAAYKLNYISKKELKYEAWKSIAYCYSKYGKIDSAVVYTNKLYEAVHPSKNHEMKRYANILMGIVSFQSRLLEDTKKYYEKALEISISIKKETNYKVDYYNLGLVNTALKNYEKGIKYLEKAEYYTLKSNDKRLLSRVYGTMADNYGSQGKNEERIECLNKANEIAKSINDQKLLAMGANHQMQWNNDHGKIKEAYNDGKILAKKMKTINLPLLKTANDSLMYLLAKKRGASDTALAYLESYLKGKVKLLKQNGRKQIEAIKVKYEIKHKNTVIEKQKLEILAAKRTSKIIFLISLLIILSTVFIVYIKNKEKKIIGLIYKKEKEKDAQIKKIFERFRFKNYSIFNKDKESKNSNNKELITNNKTEEIFDKLMDIIENEKLYLKPDLDQNEVVKLVGTNKRYIYEAISKFSDTNFRGIVNRLRINEAKIIIETKISNKEEINYSSIYSESGFNSNSSFYRTFKAITGITPNDYAMEFKKEISEK